MSLCDQYGRPVSSAGLYPSPSSHPQDNRPRPTVRKKIWEEQTARTRNDQVDCSKIVATQVTGIDAALGMKARFSVGDAWELSYQGSNRAWGDKLESLFNDDWSRNCNAMGPQHDWRATLRELCRVMDVEADYALWFDDRTGQFQVLDYSRIGNGDTRGISAGNGLESLSESGKADSYAYSSYYSTGWGGAFPIWKIDNKGSWSDGMRIVDGVIVDANMRPVGYRILGFDSEGSPAFVDAMRWQVHFNFEAGDWTGQLRGIPGLANLLDDANDVVDILWYWKQGVKIASQKMVTRTSLDGAPSRGVRETEIEVVNPDGTSGLRMVRVEDAPAGVTELSSRRGEELKTLDLNRPSMQEQALVEQVETAFFAKHWPRCLIHPDALARAGARAVVQQVQAIINTRQMALERSARWIANRKTAWSMRRGALPENNNLGDAYNTAFTVPALFTVDEGNDGKLMLSMRSRGIISHGVICSYYGVSEKKMLRSNVSTLEMQLTEAEAISARHSWLTPMDALNRLDNNGNPNVQPTPPEPQGNPQADDPQNETSKAA
jgi:hypothetical protein